MTAQTPGSIDQSFIIGNSINSGGDIRVLATQSDGKTLVGGNFIAIIILIILISFD